MFAIDFLHAYPHRTYHPRVAHHRRSLAIRIPLIVYHCYQLPQGVADRETYVYV